MYNRNSSSNRPRTSDGSKSTNQYDQSKGTRFTAQPATRKPGRKNWADIAKHDVEEGETPTVTPKPHPPTEPSERTNDRQVKHSQPNTPQARTPKTRRNCHNNNRGNSFGPTILSVSKSPNVIGLSPTPINSLVTPKSSFHQRPDSRTQETVVIPKTVLSSKDAKSPDGNVNRVEQIQVKSPQSSPAFTLNKNNDNKGDSTKSLSELVKSKCIDVDKIIEFRPSGSPVFIPHSSEFINEADEEESEPKKDVADQYIVNFNTNFNAMPEYHTSKDGISRLSYPVSSNKLRLESRGVVFNGIGPNCKIAPRHLQVTPALEENISLSLQDQQLRCTRDLAFEILRTLKPPTPR